MIIREHKKWPNGLADLLNYAALVDEGVMLMKDGALLSTWSFTGPDLQSSSALELNALSSQINSALVSLGDGWMLNVDMLRQASVGYPAEACFPDPTTELIDLEREALYRNERYHFESSFYLTLTYKPPLDAQSRFMDCFSSRKKEEPRDWSQTIEHFKRQSASIVDALGARLDLEFLNSEALLSFLHCAVTGESHPVALPSPPIYLDCLLASKDFYGGYKPRIGNKHIRVLTIAALPAATSPEMLAFLSQAPCELRWSTRFIFLDPQSAISALKTYRRNWFQKREGAAAILKDALKLPSDPFQNNDAVRMANDADEAITEASEAVVKFGFFTPTIVLMSEDEQEVVEVARNIQKQIGHYGFPSYIEEQNAVEAYLGAIPGHATPNIRRPMVHTLNLSHLLPLSTTWPGLETCPSPLMPPASPALLHGATNGATPFRFNLHVSDVGHSLIIGPTGSGKSTLVGLIMAQWLRYKNAKVFAFDKGYSSYVLAKASGARHYDLAGPRGTDLAFMPLAALETVADRLWAQQWLEDLVTLQGVSVNAEHRKALKEAISLLRESEDRTLTSLPVQNEELRLALEHYTVAGAMPMLDAEKDCFTESPFQVFELEHLMALGKENVLPVLLYLFRRIESSLDGSPTLIVLEEAWLMLAHQVFKDRIEQWLRTLRKKNAAVVFVTQSLSEIAGNESAAFILESCPTKVLLPNPEALNSHNELLYKSVGLSQRQVEIIAQAVPKRQYYYSSPLGSRLFELDLGAVALSFLGLGDKESHDQVDKLQSAFGDEWPAHWLQAQGLEEEAKAWRNLREDVECAA